MKRVILHCDLNCFFASAEMLYRPQLRHIPMAVAGDPLHRHGIILAKNVLAKKMGVKTAETINDAKRKCPDLHICKPDYDRYEYLSKQVRKLYLEYTDLVEPFGMDECWLDVTASISYFGGLQNIVNDLLFRVKNEIGLTLSVGISFNKVYAKLGSDLAKEDSFFYVDSLEDIRFLPAADLLNIGSHTCEKLKLWGIHTIGDLSEVPLAFLEEKMGKWGIMLHEYACGLDESPVSSFHPEESVKSIGNSFTAVRDLKNLDDFKIVLTLLSDSVSSRLKEKGMYFKTIQLQLRDKNLKTRSMQMSLAENTDLGKDIFDCCLKLFMENCSFAIPLRSFGVSVSHLSHTKDVSQISLFSEERYSLKQKKKEEAIETIRRRYGYQSICSLRILEDRKLADFDHEGDEP